MRGGKGKEKRIPIFVKRRKKKEKLNRRLRNRSYRKKKNRKKGSDGWTLVPVGKERRRGEKKHAWLQPVLIKRLGKGVKNKEGREKKGGEKEGATVAGEKPQEGFLTANGKGKKREELRKFPLEREKKKKRRKKTECALKSPLREYEKKEKGEGERPRFKVWLDRRKDGKEKEGLKKNIDMR